LRRDERWFALLVKPRHEKTTASALRCKGLEEFLPLHRCLHRWVDRVRELDAPLFPRYVFCRFDPQDRLPVLKTPGVISIVGIGRDPAPVEDSEITALQSIMKSGLPAEPWPFLQVGQFVRIEAGPMQGLEGILLDFRNHQRVVVSIALLQRSVAVEIERLWVTPIGVRCSPPSIAIAPRTGSEIRSARAAAA
jgi:transcription antitermination factor NusG